MVSPSPSKAYTDGACAIIFQSDIWFCAKWAYLLLLLMKVMLLQELRISIDQGALATFACFSYPDSLAVFKQIGEDSSTVVMSVSDQKPVNLL